MAGRRLRKAVREVLVDGGVQDPIITIAGLANSYTVSSQSQTDPSLRASFVPNSLILASS